MSNSFALIPMIASNKLAVNKIIELNEITLRYGLMLSPAEALELVATRTHALNANGRIELAGGIINKLIIKFCDSPYLSKHNYTTTLNDLVETFYYFKNETLDEISDDELISLMKQYFDRNCQGSIELLQNRELETLARNIRYGIHDYAKVSQGDEFLEEDYDDE